MSTYLLILNCNIKKKTLNYIFSFYFVSNCTNYNNRNCLIVNAINYEINLEYIIMCFYL